MKELDDLLNQSHEKPPTLPGSNRATESALRVGSLCSGRRRAAGSEPVAILRYRYSSGLCGRAPRGLPSFFGQSPLTPLLPSQVSQGQCSGLVDGGELFPRPQCRGPHRGRHARNTRLGFVGRDCLSGWNLSWRCQVHSAITISEQNGQKNHAAEGGKRFRSRRQKQPASFPDAFGDTFSRSQSF